MYPVSCQTHELKIYFHISLMNPVLSVLLAVALCFSVFSVAVFAEGEDIQLKLDAPANAKTGDTITVTVSLESNKGYAGLMY